MTLDKVALERDVVVLRSDNKQLLNVLCLHVTSFSFAEALKCAVMLVLQVEQALEKPLRDLMFA